MGVYAPNWGYIQSVFGRSCCCDPFAVATFCIAGAVEFALIIGGIIGIFTFFEYGSTAPGFVDFRYAPPYNRFRAFTITTQVIAITLVCRAVELGLSEAAIVDWARQAAQLLDFEFSPVSMGIDAILTDSRFSDTTAILLVYSISTSFVIGIGLTAIFALFLWVFPWPSDRENFNLWANLPTFQPKDGSNIPRRLRRDAYFNIILGAALIYALPLLPTFGIDWLTVDIFEIAKRWFGRRHCGYLLQPA